MRFTIVLITLFASVAASADIYKWEDESGTTHYGDTPPDDNAQTVQVDGAPERDPGHESRREKRQRLLEIMSEERQEARELKAEAAAKKKRRQAKCRAARKELQAIRNAAYLYRKTGDPDNPAIYSDEQRAAITRGAEEAVQKWCN